jgi:hypothetical protein
MTAADMTRASVSGPRNARAVHPRDAAGALVTAGGQRLDPHVTRSLQRGLGGCNQPEDARESDDEHDGRDTGRFHG